MSDAKDLNKYPYPSKDYVPFAFNVKKIDEFVNSTDEHTDNRKDRNALTWFGIEEANRRAREALNYKEIDYVAGNKIDGLLQYVIAPDGNAYQISPSTELPYTLTGDWATDSPNFMLMGDLPLRNELAQPNGTSLIGFGDRNLNDFLNVFVNWTTPEIHGALGDGVADDTQSLRAALASKKLVVGSEGAVYRCTDFIESYANFNMNGSKLLFNLDGEQQAFVMKSGSIISNGKIEIDGVNASGGGQFQTPIVIGNYSTGEGQYNITCDNLEIVTNRENGNGFLVTGDSNNVIIKNVHFPDSDKLGIGILVHWGNSFSYLTDGTFHPHNIEINNITGGKLTGTHTGGAFIFHSACYDVKVENVFVEEITATFGVLAYFAGDYGAYYAPEEIKPHIMSGLVARNVTALKCHNYGVRIGNRSTLDPEKAIYPGPSLYSVNARGLGASLSSPSSYGLDVRQCLGGLAEDCNFSGFYHGGYASDSAKNFKVYRSSFFKNWRYGFAVGHNTNPPENIYIENCKLYANNIDTNGNYGGAQSGQAIGTQFIDCEFGLEDGVENQYFGVRVEQASSKTSIKGCHVNSIRSGGAGYSIATSSTSNYDVLYEFSGNTSANGITHVGGMTIIPISRSSTPSGDVSVWVGGSKPTSGSWKKGARILNLTAGIGQYSEYICTESGTPGVWGSSGMIS